MRTFLLALTLLPLLAGCATWSTAQVEQSLPAKAEARNPKADASQILILEGDLTDQAYKSLGDISVTVNKTTIFHPDPTPELVNAELRKEAAKLGADAVIFVRYGSVGMSFLSWGSLDGKGRAIAFKR